MQEVKSKSIWIEQIVKYIKVYIAIFFFSLFDDDVQNVHVVHLNFLWFRLYSARAATICVDGIVVVVVGQKS